MNSAIRTNNVSALKRTLVLAFIANVVFIAIAVSIVGKWGDFVSATQSLPASAFAVTIALASVNYLVRGLRYHYLNRSLGIKLGLWETLQFYFAGFGFSLTPGRIGEFARIWLIRRSHSYPARVLAPPIFMDRLCDLFAALALCLCTVVFYLDKLQYLVVAVALIAVGFCLLLWPSLLLAALRLGAQWLPRSKHLFAQLRRIVRQISTLLRPKVLLPSLLVSVLAWSAEALALFVLARSFTPDIHFASVVFIFAFANLIGTLTFIPGGLGGTETIMVTMLMGLNMHFEAAAAATFVLRTGTLWFGVSLGIVFVVWLLRRAVPVHAISRLSAGAEAAASGRLASE
ncbi:MAG: lysylphosphatidylglycerol synthase transmembrane domain-containing protein [Ancalomicrobiaceae bacterium]|nr:lysylphosphatidylglycerol synthase transmembrane domain-containing protein [Ancalomicrobiaceae bacterium]